MFKLLMLGAGIAIGVYAVRKVQATQQHYRPQAVADRATVRAGGVKDRLNVAIAEGRRAATLKEAELRAVYRVHDVPDADPDARNPDTPGRHI